jgi:hypothetical protein
MFTLPTLPKILLIVLVIGAIWWCRSQLKRRGQAELDRNPKARADKNKTVKPIEDMMQCRVCNAYVPAVGPSRCGRENCPY